MPMRLSGALPTDWPIAALGAIVLGVNTVDAQGGDVSDLVQNGGTVAVGVLLGLYVFLHIVEKVIPLLRGSKDNKKEKPPVWTAGGPVDTHRFRTDVVSGMAQIKLLTQQVRDLHNWHSVLGPDGAPVWYGNAEVLRQLADILDRMETQQQATQHIVCDVRDEIRRQQS